MPEPKTLGIGGDELSLLLASTSEFQVSDGLLVDGEDRACRAVFGRHVPDSRSICHRQLAHTRAVELHELADHTMLTKHLSDHQDQVSRSGSERELTTELESDHLRYEHRDWLT